MWLLNKYKPLTHIFICYLLYSFFWVIPRRLHFMCRRFGTIYVAFILKQSRCTTFSNLFFGIKLYMFRTVPLSIIRSYSLSTQQWDMSYRFAESLRAGSGRNCSSVLILLASCQQNLYDIYHCCVQWKSPDDGQRNCPKHVEFYSKNTFEKLLLLVGFAIRFCTEYLQLYTWNKPFL